MADTMHEGWNISARLDFSPFEKANKLVKSLDISAQQAEKSLNRMKMNSGLDASLGRADRLTASYVKRLESEGKTYEANQTKVKQYTHAIDHLKGQQQQLEGQLTKTAHETGITSSKYIEQKTKINETATAINEYKKKLSAAQAEETRTKPTFFNRAYKGSQKLTGAVATAKDKLHGAWENIKGGATVAAGAIGAVGAAALHGAKQAGSLQQTYREITNLAVLGGEKSRSVTRSVAQMQEQGRDISIRYGKSQQTIAAGYEDLIKRGYTTKQALGALKTEVQASVASGDSFNDVTTVSSQVLDAFGMRANSTKVMLRNTKQVVNELAYSADATSTGFSDLGIAMSYVGTAAKNNHISLSETASALGVLSNNGLESDKAGTALRSTINGLTAQIGKIDSKNSVFKKLGITKKDMVDSRGNLRGLSKDMSVLWQHIKEHSQGGSDESNYFKSIFGTSGMNGAEILAKNASEVGHLTTQTEKYGKSGKYVAELAAKNMNTANGASRSATQAMNAFTMTLGNAALPAINEASNALAKFLLSKDGKVFQKDIGGAVRNVADGLVNLTRWSATHTHALKFIGGAILAGYSAVKAAEFVKFLGDTRDAYLKLAKASPKVAKLGKSTVDALGKTKFKKLSWGGKLAVSAQVVFNAVQIGNDFYKAITSSSLQAKESGYGSGIGAIIGGAIGYSLGGRAGAQIGIQLGQAMGPKAAKSFMKGFNPSKSKLVQKVKLANGKVEKLPRTANTRWVTKGDTTYLENIQNKSERSAHSDHSNVDVDYELEHPHDPLSFIGAAYKSSWNMLTHIGDRSWWGRDKSQKQRQGRGTWLDNIAKNVIDPVFNPHYRPPKQYRTKGDTSLHTFLLNNFQNWAKSSGLSSWWNQNRNFALHGGSARPNSHGTSASRWWDSQVASLQRQFKPLSHAKIDWGWLDPKKNGLANFFGGFHPQIHGKAPSLKNMKLQADSFLPNLHPVRWAERQFRGFHWPKLPKMNAKGWGSAISTGIKKGMKGLGTWFGKTSAGARKYFTGKWHGMQKWAGGINKNVKGGWRGFKSWAGNTSRGANRWFKSHWSGMQKWAGGVQKKVHGGWNGFKSWAGNTSRGANRWFKDKWSGMQSWAGKIQKNVHSGWSGFSKWFGNIAKNAVDFFKKPFDGLSSWFHEHVQKPFGAAINGAKNFLGLNHSANAKQFNNLSKSQKAKVARSVGGMFSSPIHFASGTNWKSKYGIPAVVNDGNDSPATNNREAKISASGVLSLFPNKRNYRTVIKPGENVVNAKDTAKIMAQSALHHFAAGTVRLSGTKNAQSSAAKMSKSVTNDYKKMNSNSAKSLRKIDSNNKSTWSKVSRTGTKSVNQLARKNKETWSSINRNTNKQTSKTRRNTISDYTNMRSKVNKQMDAMHDSVIKTATSTSKGLGKGLDKSVDYASHAMHGTIDQLNKGINGVDKVLSEFGGNGTAIKPVHFAMGSGGRLPHNMLAVINDAKSGPRQESVVRGNNLIIPSGNDRLFPLQKNDQVLNGEQTQTMAHAYGLPHFATGSGVSHGALKNLYHIAKHNWQQPEQTAKQVFPQHVDIRGGAGKIANAANKTGFTQGTRYWETLWELAHKKVDSDDSGPASGLLKAVEHYGEGHRYVWGAAGPSTFDCSGLVMYALKHAYGINYPHFSGSQYSRTKHISKSEAHMGDLVFWGAGGDEHVGVYAGGNKYFSAESPAQGIHMNTLSSVVGKGRPLFGRVEGANTEGHTSKKESVKTNTALGRFVKNSAGSGFWSTMKKIGDEFGSGGSMANPAGDGVMRWKPAVKKALRENGFSASPSQVSAWLRVIARESNGNPHAINKWDSNAAAGHPSKGLVQTIDSTFDAYAKKGHHNIYNGYDDLLAGINYMAHVYGRGASAFARVSGPEGYFKGGDHYGKLPFVAGEHGPELVSADGHVHIDNARATRSKTKSLADLLNPKKSKINPKDILNSIKIQKPTQVRRSGNSRPVINININGNISSRKDADFVTDLITRKLADLFEDVGDNFGTEPETY